MSTKFEDDFNDDIKEFNTRDYVKKKRHLKYQRDDRLEKKIKMLWSALGVLIIILIIALIVVNPESNEGEKESNKQETEEAKDNTEKTTEEDKKAESVLVALDKEHEVYKLMKSYFNGAYVKCDKAAVKKVMDSMENFNVSKYETRQKYIEAYQSMKCYLLDGKDGMNVVLVTYKAKLYNKETLLPGGETFVVVKNSKGKYKVHNMLVEETMEKYIVNEEQQTELNKKLESINKSLNKIVKKDSEINTIINILNSDNSDKKNVE